MKNACKILTVIGMMLQLIPFLIQMQEDDSAPLLWGDILK